MPLVKRIFFQQKIRIESQFFSFKKETISKCMISIIFTNYFLLEQLDLHLVIYHIYDINIKRFKITVQIY